MNRRRPGSLKESYDPASESATEPHTNGVKPPEGRPRTVQRRADHEPFPADDGPSEDAPKRSARGERRGSRPADGEEVSEGARARRHTLAPEGQSEGAAARAVWLAKHDPLADPRTILEANQDAVAARVEERIIERAVERVDAAAKANEEDFEPGLSAIAPEYPTESLIGPLGDLVRSSTLPAALVAGAGLAALAGLSTSAVLYIYKNTVPPILWVPLIAPVDGGKSPALQRAFAAFHELEKSARDIYRAEYKEWRALPPKQRGPKPCDPTHILNDNTIEKLATMLDENPGRIAVHDELAGGIKAIGQYKAASGDLEKYLETWTGSFWRYSRVRGDTDIMIDHPVHSIVGCLPDTRLDVLGGGDAEGGFRPRWFPHRSTALPEDWDDMSDPASWTDTVAKLYNNEEPRDWYLTGEALTAWKDAKRRWKHQALGDESPMTREALGKADQQAARVALVLSESCDPGKGGDVQVEVMTCAVTITDYVMDCWRSVESPDVLTYNLKDGALFTAVQAWADAAAKSPDGKIDLRTISRRRIGGVRTAAKVGDVRAEYEQYYPGSVSTEERPNKGKPTVWVHAPGHSAMSPPKSGDSGDIKKARPRRASREATPTVTSVTNPLIRVPSSSRRNTEKTHTRYPPKSPGDSGDTGPTTGSPRERAVPRKRTVRQTNGDD